ncbi:MAG: antitermination protein NusG [Magnetococcales bacterium]|nr:antitermination protein NusG [Magnetococcales bacterium]MBF0116267.1 antitermination protein NusG [Magnetococcales bacterium]
MVWKILLPVLVGLLLYYLGKSHARRRQVATSPWVNVPSAPQTPWRRTLRLVALGLVVMAVLTAVLVLFNEWYSARQVVVVRVIHVETGEMVTYQALRGQVHGRTFQTTDGRQVRLADVERMEVSE